MSDPAAIERFLVDDLGLDRGSGSIPFDLDLLAGDLIDSQGIMEMVVFLEERFGIAIGDEDLVPANFQSIDAIAAFVAAKGG
jgi:acyl carrier protein